MRGVKAAAAAALPKEARGTHGQGMKTALAAAIFAALLTAPTQAQDKNLYLVFYQPGRTSPTALAPAPPNQAECELAAAIQNSPPVLTVRCEVRGPNDMIWKLQPWLVK